MVKEFLNTKKHLNLNGRLVSLERPLVMGILNCTPDSFYDGGKHSTERKAITAGLEMIEDGAAIIDVGGYSTRPGASEIPIEEEKRRVLPVIKELSQNNVIISVDTFRGEIAAEAVEAGAHIVNDISGGNLDSKMWDIVGSLKVPYILMHSRGNPKTMAGLTDYDNIVSDITDFFNRSLNSLTEKGVLDVIVDPGFGFAKTTDQNYEILENLLYFKILERPVLVGVSRKSMIWKTLATSASEALNGTTVLNTLAIERGANILRVHDVKEAVEIVKLMDKFAGKEIE